MARGRAQKPQRLVVVGTSGAGKSTVARELAAKLDLPYIELDTSSAQPVPAADGE